MAFTAYTTSNPIVRSNGATHSHIVAVGAVQITIPEDAEQRPGADGDYWNWVVKLKNGGRINMQSYVGQPGETIVADAEVREKMLAADRGGYKFLYAKLKPTEASAAVMQMLVGDGYLLQKAENLEDAGVTTIWCPQKHHFGGVVFASVNAELPAPRPTSNQVKRNATA